jgi:hypothetical protein
MLRVTHLDKVQGASESRGPHKILFCGVRTRTEPYLNTVREYWSWQRSNAPKIPEQSKLCLDWAGMVRKA